jgi:CheY-like chemotaxis protein/anti-sigma regulatory factor (Ser/Thr protein kinase)
VRRAPETGPTRVLVVDDNPADLRLVAEILKDTDLDLDLRTARDGLEALAALENAHDLPQVILTDLQMPRLNGLALVEEVRESHPRIPVVVMTAYGNEDIAFESLRKGAAGYVPKRSFATGLAPTLRQMIEIAQLEREDVRLFRFVSRAESVYMLPNEPRLIPPLVAHFVLDFGRIVDPDENESIRLSIALGEALANAMLHGNLELDSTALEAGEARGFYEDLAGARLEKEPYRSRRVHVTATLTPEAGTYVIRDEGPGFDLASLIDPRDPANLEKVTGRGLFLIRTFMDEVLHNETGNAITLIKRRSRRG